MYYSHLQRQITYIACRIAHIACQCICRQEKSKQLASLQSELHLLESDIKQVAARQPALPTATPEPAQLQLTSRQHSTQLLQERLQEGMPRTAKQSTIPSSALGIHDRPPATLAAAAAAVAASQQIHPAAGMRSMPSGSLPQATAMTSTPVMPAHQYLMQPPQPQADRQSQPQPGIILAHHGVSQPLDSSQQPGNTAAADTRQSLQPRLARASNGYLMINHPYPSTSADVTQQQLPAGHSGAASTHGGPATTSTGTAGTAGIAAASGRHASGVPLPTQMERQQSMHIHPRHLAFQHFHALQQRQQMARQNSAGPAVASAAPSTGTAVVGEPPSQAATQEAALRYFTHVYVHYSYAQGTDFCLLAYRGSWLTTHVGRLLHIVLSAGRSLLQLARSCMVKGLAYDL